MPLESSFVPTPSGRFHLVAIGQGKPVLFIHGGTASTREWHPVLEGLGRHARCVAIDRLGCGLSDRSVSYDRETVTDSHFALADALGWERFGVVGQSYGGIWALSLAFARPERISRLVLVNTAGGPTTAAEVAQWRARGTGEQPPSEANAPDATIDATVRTIFADPGRVPATFREDLRWQMERADPAQMAGGWGQLADQIERMGRERYDLLRIPTLVVWGEADAMNPTEQGHRLAAAIPGARYVGLPGVGHTCQIEAPEKFVAAVAPFLDATANDE